MADQVIIVNPEQQARQQMLEDMKRLKAKPLDKSIPGGVFVNAGGEGYHNAHGQPVTKDGKPVEADEAEEAPKARGKK